LGKCSCYWSRRHKNPGDGLQQAKEYAEVLDLKFAYATNGHSIVEHDFLTGKETNLDTFPKEDKWEMDGPYGYPPPPEDHAFVRAETAESLPDFS
jgi:type I restriction enzyme R subunit